MAPGLTLGGTTIGTFSGNLAGNATTATSATSFTGSLAGDVTGTQGATVVSAVGGVTSANVAAGANLTNAATNANTPNAIVLRDPTGSFGAGSLTLNGSLTLPVTTSANVGAIMQGGNAILHTFGSENFFAGFAAGNFGTTGSGNTAAGFLSLNANTTGQFNAADGVFSLSQNTSGNGNTAMGGSALAGNTTASQNVGIGTYALLTQSYSNSGTTWNSNNVAVGYQALQYNQPISTTTGTNNTALGTHALFENTTGSYNTATGSYALELSTTGMKSCGIGWRSSKRSWARSQSNRPGLPNGRSIAIWTPGGVRPPFSREAAGGRIPKERRLSSRLRATAAEQHDLRKGGTDHSRSGDVWRFARVTTAAGRLPLLGRLDRLIDRTS